MGRTAYLTHRDGRSLTTNKDGSFNSIPAEAFSQFKVEIVEAAGSGGVSGGGGGVRFRNVKGEYLSENMDWSKTATNEQIFTAVKQEQFQAFRGLNGEYLSLKDDGSLEMVTVPSTQPTTQPQPPSTECQAGWSEFNGVCYKLFDSELKKWDDAKNECEQDKVRRSLACK